MLMFYRALQFFRARLCLRAGQTERTRRPATRAPLLLVAGVLALTSNLFSAELATVPGDLQAAIFKKIFGYTKTLSPDAASRLVVVHDGRQPELVEQLRKGFGQLGIQAVAVGKDQLNDQLSEGGILYVAVPDGSFRQICKEKHALSITGLTGLVEKGEVAIGLALVESKPKIVVNLSELRAQGHDLSAQLLQLAKVIQ